jgi:hypothetical protein
MIGINMMIYEYNDYHVDLQSILTNVWRFVL